MGTYHDLHREDQNRKARERYYKDKENYKARAWKNHLKRDYGITEDEYEALWIGQNGLCCICQTELASDRKPHLDHDHKTGKIRGILCPNCNRGLGAFKDDIALLLKAVDYLIR